MRTQSDCFRLNTDLLYEVGSLGDTMSIMLASSRFGDAKNYRFLWVIPFPTPIWGIDALVPRFSQIITFRGFKGFYWSVHQILFTNSRNCHIKLSTIITACQAAILDPEAGRAIYLGYFPLILAVKCLYTVHCTLYTTLFTAAVSDRLDMDVCSRVGMASDQSELPDTPDGVRRHYSATLVQRQQAEQAIHQTKTLKTTKLHKCVYLFRNRKKYKQNNVKHDALSRNHQLYKCVRPCCLSVCNTDYAKLTPSFYILFNKPLTQRYVFILFVHLCPSYV